MHPKYTVIMFVVGLLIMFQPTFDLQFIASFWNMLSDVTHWLSNDKATHYGEALAFVFAPLTIIFWKKKA